MGMMHSLDTELIASFMKAVAICLLLDNPSELRLCIIPMQDHLALDGRARINTPSTLGGNWIWRMKEGAFTHTLAKRMRVMTKLYGRLEDEENKSVH